MNKKISFLVILLISQLIIITYAYWPTDNSTPEATAFFSDLNHEDIQSVQITDEENISISLAKTNDTWTINKDGLPADPATIEALLTKIINLKSDRLVTRTKSSQARLKVAEGVFSRKILLQLKNGQAKTFYLGTSPSNKTIHFRQTADNNVFLVKDLSSWELQTDEKSWWRTTYTKFDADDLNLIKISNQHGVFSIKKEAEKGWVLVDGYGQQVDQAKKDGLNALADSLSTISLSEYIGPDKPADMAEPIAKINYQTKATEMTLDIWAPESEDGDHIVKASDSNYYVKVKTYLLKDALAANIADLKKEAADSSESSEDSSNP